MIILIIILGLIGFCIVAGVVALFLGYRFAKDTVFPAAGCIVSFEAVRESMLEYAKTHDGKLPNAATWQDDIKDIFAKKVKEFEQQDMFETFNPNGEWGCKAEGSRQTGVCFNADLGGKKVADIANPWSVPMVFEVEAPKRNQAEKYAPRPPESSPKIFGEPRGWVVSMVEGETTIQGGSGRWRTQGRGSSSSEKGEDSTGVGAEK